VEKIERLVRVELRPSTIEPLAFRLDRRWTAISGQRWPPLILLQSGRSSTPRIPFSLQPHGVHPHDGKLRGLPQCD